MTYYKLLYLYKDILIYYMLYFLLYKMLRPNKPYAVRHASEYPDPKIFWNFLDPGEQADLVYPGPKISGKFWGLGCAL